MATARRIGPWVTVAAAVLVLAALLWFGDVGSVLDALAGLAPWRVTAALGLVTVAYGLRFAKWHLLVRTLGLPVRVGRDLQVFLSGLMMSVTPAKLGELWKSVLLSQDGIPVALSLPAVAIERFVDLAAVGLLAAAGLAIVWHLPWAFPVAVALLAFAVLALRWHALWGRLADRLERRPRLARIGGFLRTIAGGARSLLAPLPFGGAILLGLCAWGLEGLALGVLLDGLGAPVPVAVAVAAFCAGTLAGVVSLLPGGLGTTEAGMVGLLVAQGVGHEAAVAATLLARACTLGYGAMVGAVASLAWPSPRAAPPNRDSGENGD